MRSVPAAEAFPTKVALELVAGAPSRKGHYNPNPAGLAIADRIEHERQLCQHAELAYRRLVTDWQRTGARATKAT